MIELSKSQKKIARELIQLGLQHECKSFTDTIAEFVNSSEWETGDPHELYLKLYKKVTSFDKQIARRYDALSGSHYFITIFELFHDGILTTEDITRFDVEVQNELRKIKERHNIDSQ
ncbi:hypothetical protein FACS1894159_01730 [Bacteroidia bacterium]|nr:hypothetical protein FACS1894159_01730 [Bacteroidia bacterium]